jgi:glyoxylase-like metal-dependent hydrolase (beta-lactamase superfamily II)
VQPHNEFRFHPRVVQIGCHWGDGGHTELYLLEGDSLVLIDTGVNDTPKQYVEPALAAYGRSLGDIDIVLNTHGHYDHTGGNTAMAAASQAPVWIHEADARSAEDLAYQFETYFTNRHLLVGRQDRLETARATFLTFAGGPTKVGRKLSTGEVLDFGRGIRLRVIHTPGHTPGSVCFFWETEGLLLAGDAIMGLSPRPGGLPLIYDPTNYERSLQHVQTLDVRTLALGHHFRTDAVPPDSIHFAEQVPRYLGACRDITGAIGDAMRRAVAAHPNAGFLETARAATNLIEGRLRITKGEDGLPLFGNVESFYGHWQLLK